jgi:hypothetical protein
MSAIDGSLAGDDRRFRAALRQWRQQPMFIPALLRKVLWNQGKREKLRYINESIKLAEPHKIKGKS